MKNLLFGIVLVCFAVLSCRSEEDSYQKIDQIISFYMQDGSKADLLIPDSIGRYSAITANDMLAFTDNAPVSLSRDADETNKNFLKYIAGATRQLESGGESDERVYRSQIRVALTKKLTDSTFSEIDNDTLQIFYRWTPTVFEVSKVIYNKSELPVTKDSENRNAVTITK